MSEKFDYADPMDEIYAIRRMISERYGHDVRRIAAAAREQMLQNEASGKRRYVRLPIVRTPFHVERKAQKEVPSERPEFATA